MACFLFALAFVIIVMLLSSELLYKPLLPYYTQDRYQDTVEKRRQQECPKCHHHARFCMKYYQRQEQRYSFSCQGCNLKFQYAYPKHYSDYQKQLFINCVCPICKVSHLTPVIGRPETHYIPCQTCEVHWQEMQAEALR